jgi:hypothetical protein
LVDRLYSEPLPLHELLQRSVNPYLETNRLRPRVRAIQKARPIAYRAKVLGRALLAARTNANSFWILLSGNAEVAFPLTIPTATPTANLPTPASAAATANVAAVAASVVATLTTTATESLPLVAGDIATSAATPSTDSASGVFDPTVSAAANVASTPYVGQKRKAHP